MHGVEIRIGHVLDELGKLPAESVQCVVTSPPYWGLRDYGLEPVVWGGESGCGHEWQDEITSRPNAGGGEGKERDYGAAAQFANTNKRQTIAQFCLHCPAWRGSLGLEPTPELYVEHLVSVFREVRRVLRADGTVWLNLGDSYTSCGRSARKESPGVGAKQEMAAPGRTLKWKAGGGHNFSWSIPSFGTELKPKDLVMIPARVALALQADGWYLRSEIVWAKPNPMPESVRDRPTKAHEMIYLLSKSERYYYDASAVKEPQSQGTFDRFGNDGHRTGSGLKQTDSPNGLIRDKATYSKAILPEGRNLRTVWTIPTAPYPEAHFATFPPALVEPCIKAGTAPGDTVLDPFAGSGTVGEVARKWGRKAILIEAQPKYRELIEKRLRQGVLLA